MRVGLGIRAGPRATARNPLATATPSIQAAHAVTMAVEAPRTVPPATAALAASVAFCSASPVSAVSLPRFAVAARVRFFAE